MPLGLWMLVAWMVFMALIGVGFLVWGWRRGQFHNVEEPKYRMLEDSEPEPWPGKEPHERGGRT